MDVDKRIGPRLADKSAVGAMNRPLPRRHRFARHPWILRQQCLVEHALHQWRKEDRSMEKMSVKQMVEDARTRVKGLSKEEMQRELEAGEALIVDIRDVRERWRRGTIPGAKHVPRGMLEFWADPESEYYKSFMDPRKRTILYCAGGQR